MGGHVESPLFPPLGSAPPNIEKNGNISTKVYVNRQRGNPHFNVSETSLDSRQGQTPVGAVLCVSRLTGLVHH